MWLSFFSKSVPTNRLEAQEMIKQISFESSVPWDSINKEKGLRAPKERNLNQKYELAYSPA
jgi:hypothetical protein